MLKKVLYILGFFLVLAYLVAAIVYFSGYSDSTRCSGLEVRVEGKTKHAFMQKADVERDLKRLGFTHYGKQLDSIDLHRMERNLRTNSFFRGAELYASPSGRLYLAVEQKDPLFMVVRSDTSFYVSTDRSVIVPNLQYAAPVLIASGHISLSLATGPLFDLIAFISDDPFWSNFFTQVYVPDNGQIMLVPRMGKTEIIIGSTPNWAEKLSNLRLFMDKAIPKYGWDTFKTLNLEFKDQVVATPFPSSPLYPAVARVQVQ